MDVGDLMDGVTSERCTATAKGTGERCRKLAIRGGKVCQTHGGGAPQVRERAADRVALAEAMATAPRRHPAEVLLDTLHAADLMMRRQIAVGDPIDGEGLAVLLGALERAQRFARATLELDAASRLDQMFAQTAARFVAMFDAAMLAAGLSDDQLERARESMRDSLDRMAGGCETP